MILKSLKMRYPKLNRLDITLHINRPAIDGDTLQETYREDYAEGIRLLREKEYMEALELLAKYADYNTALALVCLGYNDKAEEVLDALPESGRNEYLLAIVKARTERKNEAVKHLQKACELSPELYNRTRLDSEVRDLADEFNLWETLKN
jgi:tetratricopeptide (TPR) repeat protein